MAEQPSSMKLANYRSICRQSCCAATNRDLAKEVDKGTFRRDLYFRLNVINIRLTPLRERKEDIPALVSHFLNRVGGNYSITAEAMEILLSYDWPGNIRELENCIQHLVAVNTGPLLHVGDFPSALQNHLLHRRAQYLMAAAAAPAGSSTSATETEPGRIPPPAPENFPGIVPLVELERRAIMSALEYTRGDRAIAAHLLGIGRTTLYRKIKEYQLAG
jgi:DNA-binding NtrC family response regulator